MREFPVISADSHITEHPDTYLAHIESAWKDKAPRMVDGGEKGDLFVIDGMNQPIAMGLVAAAGKPPEEITTDGVRFEALHRGGWDPDARLVEQDRDGVAAEIIYPTVGMLLCNHKDFDYKKACFDAYNRWITEYCERHPSRLLGCGQTAMRTPEEGVADLHAIKSLGLRGVMMPGNPAVEDYDSDVYNPVWEAAIELDLPLSFHILTTRWSAWRPMQVGCRTTCTGWITPTSGTVTGWRGVWCCPSCRASTLLSTSTPPFKTIGWPSSVPTT
jgi:predicted TIM-barrel fold metal-dependent hydrolase